MQQQTDNRGGARPGAGRPSTGTAGQLLRLHRTTSKALAQTVKSLPPGDRWGAKSRIADSAIREKLGLPPLNGETGR